MDTAEIEIQKISLNIQAISPKETLNTETRAAAFGTHRTPGKSR
jgi:hypothetical protein